MSHKVQEDTLRVEDGDIIKILHEHRIIHK